MSRVACLPPTDAPSSLPSTSVDAADLFRMGFEPADVGKALVQTWGNANAALAILRTAPSVEPALGRVEDDDHADKEENPDTKDEEARELELALKMSLETPLRPAKAPRSSAAAGNPLWAPPRYIPAGNALEAGPRTLNLIESVHVRDGGYGWQSARAFLDTGNQAMTLVDSRFAERHAIYKKENAPLLSGSSFGMAERWTTIRGVVPGASTRAPVVTIALKVRDQEMLVPAAVSDPGGSHDLLLGADVIGRLFEAGFRLGAGSM